MTAFNRWKRWRLTSSARTPGRSSSSPGTSSSSSGASRSCSTLETYLIQVYLSLGQKTITKRTFKNRYLLHSINKYTTLILAYNTGTLHMAEKNVDLAFWQHNNIRKLIFWSKIWCKLTHLVWQTVLWLFSLSCFFSPWRTIQLLLDSHNSVN